MNALPLTGLLFPLIIIGILIFALVAIIRRASKSPSCGSGFSGRRSINVPTQLDQDGFWIVSCPADPGSIIHYHYWSGGARYSGQVPFKPGTDGRQFVYTGRQPGQVSIVRIMEVDDGDMTSSLIPPIIAVGSTWDPPDPGSDPGPSSQSSFPAAY
jgi:hypothetical protein